MTALFSSHASGPLATRKGMKNMKTTYSPMRSWITTSIISLMAICFLLVTSGCRTGQIGTTSVAGWRDWLPRSHRGLVRQRIQTQREAPVDSSGETVVDNSKSADSNRANSHPTKAAPQIAPIPPTPKSQSSEVAPSPATDIQDLIAIDEDLAPLEITPEAGEPGTTPVETTAGDKPTAPEKTTEATTETTVPKLQPLRQQSLLPKLAKPTTAAAPDPTSLQPLLETVPSKEEIAPSAEATAPGKAESPSSQVELPSKPTEATAEITAPKLQPLLQQSLLPRRAKPAAAAAPDPTSVQPLLETVPSKEEIAPREEAAAPEKEEIAPREEANLPNKQDKEIAQAILERFKQFKEQGTLRDFEISLRVIHGTAELSGELISNSHYELLINAVRAIPGVQRIEDRLVVSTPKHGDLEDGSETGGANRLRSASKPMAREQESGGADKNSSPGSLDTSKTPVKSPIELPNPVEENLLRIR